MSLSGDLSRKQRDITIRIGETRISISIPAEEESELHLRRAAKVVNDLLVRYRQHFPDASKEDTLAYVALHCARDFCELEYHENNKQTEKRLSALLESIEDALM